MHQLSLFEDKGALTLARIQYIFVECYRELRIARSRPSIHVEFYPFVGINHTIRFRNGELYARISDLFREAPPEIIKALAMILFCKLFRRRIPTRITHAYRAFVNSVEMKEKSLLTRSQRGRKLLSDPKGLDYNLTCLFDKLNTEYFGGQLGHISLGWSLRKSRRILGHFDPSHSSITISRIFDDRRVPEFVISYVLFHEMLHAQFSTSSNFDLKNRHSSHFKKEEKKFKWYKESNDWLKENL
ncbi:MAG: hypothetical protein DMG05_01675 [Acidobacteria bacterium]|nr:MAG: hypothetical protein DMG05_01675 [Acidobacteriota bacterium]